MADLEQMRQTHFFQAIEEVKDDSRVFGEVCLCQHRRAPFDLVQGSLNRFMALGRSVWKRVRTVLQHVFALNSTDLRDHDELKYVVLPIFCEAKMAESEFSLSFVTL